MKELIVISIIIFVSLCIIFFHNLKRKEYVDFYAKIYTDNFPVVPWKKIATSEQVYNFLMSDVGLTEIPGDKVIWYLGCNEKFGHIKYKKVEWEWNFGQSSFDVVYDAIVYMYLDNFFTEEQFLNLSKKINEGRLFDNMYEISNYLKLKDNYKKSKKDFRIEAREFFNGVKDSLESSGIELKTFGNKIL